MEKHEQSLNWIKCDYFTALKKSEKAGASDALELLVEDLHLSKQRTVDGFLCHPGSEDFMHGLMQLLKSQTTRVAGNTAYVIGTIAESTAGSCRLLSIIGQKKNCFNIVEILTGLLDLDDTETVMNAAGTLGTLAENTDGRDLILLEDIFTEMMQKIIKLLKSSDIWTASNAALVIARLTISESGCKKLFEHPGCPQLMAELIHSLGLDQAGRGMNAAFAIGRLCDYRTGLDVLLKLPEKNKLISALYRMLQSGDGGPGKNSCFCLSCLAASLEGHDLIINSPNLDDLLTYLARLIMAMDPETAWFAGMTLRTLASQPKGCVRLRGHCTVVPSLQRCITCQMSSDDLKEEAASTLAILEPLAKPSAPVLQVLGATEAQANWASVKLKSGFDIRYQLYKGPHRVYDGPGTQCRVTQLLPFTDYAFRLRIVTEADESPFSDEVNIQTEESVPCEPANLRTLAITTTQAKIAWEPPDRSNGILKGYSVYLGERHIEQTQELSSIISGLSASTEYEISVCGFTVKGKGSKATIILRTLDLGDHACKRPTLNPLGRSQMQVTWEAPNHPLGRINRYEVVMNGSKVVYTGVEPHCKISGLSPNTEYSFTVTVITNEGKFESKLSKKKTLKDEYGDAQRAPLYEPLRRENTIATDTVSASRRYSMSSSRSSRTSVTPSSVKVMSDGDKREKRPATTSVRRSSLQQKNAQTSVARCTSSESKGDKAQVSMKTFQLQNDHTTLLSAHSVEDEEINLNHADEEQRRGSVSTTDEMDTPHHLRLSSSRGGRVYRARRRRSLASSVDSESTVNGISEAQSMYERSGQLMMRRSKLGGGDVGRNPERENDATSTTMEACEEEHKAGKPFDPMWSEYAEKYGSLSDLEFYEMIREGEEQKQKQLKHQQKAPQHAKLRPFQLAQHQRQQSVDGSVAFSRGPRRSEPFVRRRSLRGTNSTCPGSSPSSLGGSVNNVSLQFDEAAKQQQTTKVSPSRFFLLRRSSQSSQPPPSQRAPSKASSTVSAVGSHVVQFGSPGAPQARVLEFSQQRCKTFIEVRNNRPLICSPLVVPCSQEPNQSLTVSRVQDQR